MSIRFAPKGWEEILDIFGGRRPMDEFPALYEPIAHMRSTMEVRMWNVYTGNTENLDFMSIPACINNLPMLQYLVGYFRQTMKAAERANLCVMAAEACKAAKEFRAFRCWAYLRRVAQEEKAFVAQEEEMDCPTLSRMVDEIPTPLFSAVEYMSLSGFQKLIDDGFCDLNEEKEGVTPLAFAEAEGKCKYAAMLSTAGAVA